MSVLRRTALVVPALLLAGAVTSCTAQAGTAGDQGFVAGDGIITLLDEADRKRPAEVAGVTLDGDRVALSDYEGQVVVVNVWGSWCAPCRSEAPVLAEAARDLADQDVAFLGIDSRDPSRSAAQAFVRRFDIPYPSIYDQQGRTLLSFRGTLNPNAIPATVVVDRQGRVAASVLGEVTRTTLHDLVEEVAGTDG